MHLRKSIHDQIHDAVRSIRMSPQFGDAGLGQDSSGTDWLTSLVSALPQIATTGIQAYSAITTANSLAQRGIYPTSYSANGQPIYASTPAGVTPSNPYSLPSGYALPAGVTPTVYQTPLVASPTNALGLSQNAMLALMLGGGALLAVMLLK